MFISKELKTGINYHYIKDQKFSTFACNISLYIPMSRETVTKLALLGKVLRSATQKHKTLFELNRQLDMLYGARLGVYTQKKGEHLALSLRLEQVSDRFLTDAKLAQQGVELLGEVLLQPLVENGAFCEESLQREKQNLKNEIESVIQDKREYALLRLVEIMCENEPYGVRANGYVEDLHNITAENLYEFYTSVLHSAQIEIQLVGDFDEKVIDVAVDAITAKLPGRVAEKSPISGKNVAEIAYTNEEQDVLQGKLAIGARLPEAGYAAMQVYNSVFGGGPHSKLFQNVRERLSLCYYASSSVVRFKNIMLIQAGIEIGKYTATVDEILAQHTLMQKGEFSDEDINNAKLALINAYKSYNDSLHQTLEFVGNATFEKPYLTIEECIERVKGVTREQIVGIACGVVFDTVYFLTNGGTDDGTK